MIWYLNLLLLLFALLFNLLFLLYSDFFNILCPLLLTNLRLNRWITNAALKLIKRLLIKHLMCLALIIVGPARWLHPFPHGSPACCIRLLLHPVLFIDHFHEVYLLLLLLLPLFFPNFILFLPLNILLLLSQLLFLSLFLHFCLYFLPDTIHMQWFFKILLGLLRSWLTRKVWLREIRVAELLYYYIIRVFNKDKSFMWVQLRLRGNISLITHLGIRMINLCKFAKSILGLLCCASTINL